MGRSLVLAFSALALLASACGGGDGEESGGSDATTASSASADDGGGSSGDGGGSATGDAGSSGGAGGSGSFTVNGAGVTVTNVLRCVPFSFGEDPDPRDLSIVILGETGGANIDVTYNQGIGPEGQSFDQPQLQVLLSLNGTAEQYDGFAASNIDEAWFTDQPILADQEPGTPLDGPPFTVDGNSISGSLSELVQSWPQGADGTADVSWNVSFPDDEMDC